VSARPPIHSRTATIPHLGCLLALLCSTACWPGYLRLQLEAPPNVNQGLPLHVLLRAVEPPEYMRDSRTSIGNLLAVSDPSVLVDVVVLPPRSQRWTRTLWIKRPGNKPVGVYFLFAAPQGTRVWRRCAAAGARSCRFFNRAGKGRKGAISGNRPGSASIKTGAKSRIAGTADRKSSEPIIGNRSGALFPNRKIAKVPYRALAYFSLTGTGGGTLRGDPRERPPRAASPVAAPRIPANEVDRNVD